MNTPKSKALFLLSTLGFFLPNYSSLAAKSNPNSSPVPKKAKVLSDHLILNQAKNELEGEEKKTKKKKRSTEWRRLPRQSWEKNHPEDYANLQSLATDKAAASRARHKTEIEVHSLPTTFKLNSLGKIIGSRTEAEHFFLHDLVYIKASETILVGETYALTVNSPYFVRSYESRRRGYVYSILGHVKILGVQENTFIGEIVAGFDTIPRDSILIPVPARIPELTYLPGPQPIRGYVLSNPHEGVQGLNQGYEALIDRGLEDGVKPGMIFRVFQTQDPSTGKTLTRSSFVITADLLVTQVSERLSAAQIIKGNRAFEEGAEAVLLTNVDDLKNKTGFSIKGSDSLDELDQALPKTGLGTIESQELKQLETWNPDRAVPQMTPSPKPTVKPSSLPSEQKNKPEESSAKVPTAPAIPTAPAQPPAAVLAPESAPLPNESLASAPDSAPMESSETATPPPNSSSPPLEEPSPELPDLPSG